MVTAYTGTYMEDGAHDVRLIINRSVLFTKKEKWLII